MTKTTTETLSIRIDKWLWAARFFKTRSLASDEINKGRVQINENVAKPSKEIKIGDVLLGLGSFGLIYKGEDLKKNQDVACKIVSFFFITLL